jgi:hypothetical protein
MEHFYWYVPFHFSYTHFVGLVGLVGALVGLVGALVGWFSFRGDENHTVVLLVVPILEITFSVGTMIMLIYMFLLLWVCTGNGTVQSK